LSLCGVYVGLFFKRGDLNISFGCFVFLHPGLVIRLRIKGLLNYLSIAI
jgi:hypothetical protein